MSLLCRIARVIRARCSRFTWAAVVCVTLISLALSPAHAGKSFGGTGDIVVASLLHADTGSRDATHAPREVCASHVNCTVFGTLPAVAKIGDFVPLPFPNRAMHAASGLDRAPDSPPPIYS